MFIKESVDKYHWYYKQVNRYLDLNLPYLEKAIWNFSIFNATTPFYILNVSKKDDIWFINSFSNTYTCYKFN